MDEVSPAVTQLLQGRGSSAVDDLLRRNAPQQPTEQPTAPAVHATPEQPQQPEEPEEDAGFLGLRNIPGMDAVEGFAKGAASTVPRALSGATEFLGSLAEQRFRPPQGGEVPEAGQAVGDFIRDNPVSQFLRSERERTQGEAREVAERPGAGGDVGVLAGNITGELAQLLGTAGGIRSTLGIAQKSGAAGVLQRMALASPVDAAIGASAPENSMAQLAADYMVDKGLLDDSVATELAENSGARGILEVAAVTIPDAVLTTIMAGGRALRGGRQAPKVADAATEVAEGQRALPSPDEPVALLPRATDAAEDAATSAVREGSPAVDDLLGDAAETAGRGLGEAGFAGRETQALITGGGLGALVGGSVDEENPLRGAGLGFAAGMGAVAASRHVNAGSRSSGSEATQGILSRTARKVKGEFGSAREFAEELYRGVGDDILPAVKITNAVKRKLNLDKLPKELDYEGAVRASRAAAAYGRRVFENGVMAPGETTARTVPLRRVFERIGTRVDDFEAYAIARRARELMRRGIKTPYDDADGIKWVTETLNEFGADRELNAIFDQYQNIQREWLKVLEEGGVIAPGSAQRIIKENQDYVPFFRDLDGKGGGPSSNDPIRAILGSDVEDILPPTESMIRLNYVMSEAAIRQRADNALANIAELFPNNGAVTKLKGAPAGQASGRAGQIFHSFDAQGNKVHYRVNDENLWKMRDAAGPESWDLGWRIAYGALRPFANLLRTTVTIMPDFMAANWYRDMIQSASTSRYKGAGPMALGRAAYDGLRGLSVVMADAVPDMGKRAAGGAAFGGAAGAISDPDNRLRGAAIGAAAFSGLGAAAGPAGRRFAAKVGHTPEELMNRWMTEGGAQGAFQSMDRNELKRSIKEAIDQGRTIRGVANPFEVMRSIGMAFENANRVGEFMRVIGDDGIDASMRAAVESRDVTVDFLRTGGWGVIKAVKSLSAFWGARVQGTLKLARVAKERPGQTALTIGASLTAPSMALYAVNRNNPEYWETPLWERNLFWLVPMPGGGFTRIPKPFELGWIGASLPERFVEFFDTKNPEQGRSSALEESFMDNIVQPLEEMFLPEPTALQPFWENAKNEDWTGLPIVSPFVETSALPDYLKGREGASDFARGLGRLFNMSPAKIDNIMQGYTGRLGRETLQLVDDISRREEQGPPPKREVTDTPILARFFSDSPHQYPRSLSVLYDDLREADGARRAIRMELDAGNREAAAKMVLEKKDLLDRYDLLRDAASAIGEKRDLIEQIEVHPELTAEEKRKGIDNVLRDIQHISSVVMGFDKQE